MTYTDNGGKRRQETHERKKDIDAARIRIEGEIANETHTPDSTTTDLNQLSAAFLPSCEDRRRLGDMTGQGIIGYRSRLKAVCKELGGFRLPELTSDNVQDYINLRARNGIAPSTIQGEHAVLKPALNFAIRKRWLRRNVLTDQRCSLPSQTKRTAIPDR